MTPEQLHQVINCQDSRFEPHRGICIVWRHASALVECASLLKIVFDDMGCDECGNLYGSIPGEKFEKALDAIKRLEEIQ